MFAFVNKSRLKSFDFLFFLFFVCFGFIYVSLKLSPSSYGYVLEQFFKSTDTGLIAGEWRKIRSDEWAHFTPWTQASVNNNFGRYNQYSPYKEDFRTVFPMPIRDWGLIFKPYMWPYFLLPPSFAFSLFWFSMMAVFIIGYTYVFKVILKASGFEAICLSLIIFFSGFVQYWWTNNLGAMAFLPVVILSIHFYKPKFLSFLFVYWSCVAWAMALFYPPFLIQFAFASLVLVVAFRKDFFKWKTLLTIGIAGAFAGVTVAGYFWDEIIAISQTVIPGRRFFSGGGMTLAQWYSHFFPTMLIDNHKELIGPNLCEMSVVGSYFILLTVIFLNYKTLLTTLKSKEVLIAVFVLLLAIILVTVWQLCPIPSSFGRIFFWHLTHPSRMGFLSGLLMVITSFYLAKNIGLVASLSRYLLFVTVIVYVWYENKYLRSIVSSDQIKDLFILFPVAIALCFRFPSADLNKSFLFASAISGFIAFADFNPIQSTDIIFNRPKTPVVKMLDKELAEQGGGYLAIPRSKGFPGAILTGWGYPSIGHAMFAPHMDFWKAKFPELSATELDQALNLSGHIIVSDKIDKPVALDSTVAAVPWSAFIKNYRQISTEPSPYPVIRFGKDDVNGYVESIQLKGQVVVIKGWAHWQGKKTQQKLIVLSDQPLTAVNLFIKTRPDVAAVRGGSKMLESGFQAEFSIANQLVNQPRFCVLAENGGKKKTLELANVFQGNDYCQIILRDQTKQ